METESFSLRHRDNPTGRTLPLAYLGATGVVLVTIAIAFVVNGLMLHASLSLLFLTGVLIVAARTGLGPSLVASVLSFLAYNFFFTPPYYTFDVANDDDVATLLFFLLIAAITGNLAARMYREMAKRRASLQRISNLYEFSRRMSSAAGTQEVLDALADHLSHSLHRSVVVLITDQDGKPAPRAHSDTSATIPEAVVNAAWSSATPGVTTVDSWHCLKLMTDRGPIGMVAIQGREIIAEQADLARSLCEQAAIALDRTQLVEDLEQARLVSETEQLRSALLTSVSHDLRTPLASIVGSTTSLLEYGDSFSHSDRIELLETVVNEAQRLDRHIQNLLDMTRLEQGSLTLHCDWVDLNDIISSAVERLQGAARTLPIDIDIGTDMPLLWVHGALIEQALVNLLDNAVHFSPEDGRISITALCIDSHVVIEICDDGPGIRENEREKIFDMFYTMRRGDRGNLQGTGLGLAICRGMIAAHGGTVTAHEGRQGRGTCMRIDLPLVRPQETGEA